MIDVESPMRFGGRPKEVGQCSYRVAKQLQPGLPPKLIHTAPHTGSSRRAEKPADVELFGYLSRGALAPPDTMAHPWQWPPSPAGDHILRTSNTEAACLARAGALASPPTHYLIAHAPPPLTPADRALGRWGTIRGAWWLAHAICAWE